MRNFTQTTYHKIAEIKAPKTTFTIEKLRAGSKYRFRVAAQNKFGYGEVSAEGKEWLQTKIIGIHSIFCR